VLIKITAGYAYETKPKADKCCRLSITSALLLEMSVQSVATISVPEIKPILKSQIQFCRRVKKCAFSANFCSKSVHFCQFLLIFARFLHFLLLFLCSYLLSTYKNFAELSHKLNVQLVFEKEVYFTTCNIRNTSNEMCGLP
jgi:hypothetical protein